MGVDAENLVPVGGGVIDGPQFSLTRRSPCRRMFGWTAIFGRTTQRRTDGRAMSTFYRRWSYAFPSGLTDTRWWSFRPIRGLPTTG